MIVNCSMRIPGCRLSNPGLWLCKNERAETITRGTFHSSQSAEVLALKHESKILRQDECPRPRILLSCYRARNSGPDITYPKSFHSHARATIFRAGKCLHLEFRPLLHLWRGQLLRGRGGRPPSASHRPRHCPPLASIGLVSLTSSVDQIQSS